MPEDILDGNMSSKLYPSSPLKAMNENKFISSSNTQLMDEIDLAIVKNIEHNKTVKSLTIEKVKRGIYKLNKKEYPFKLLSGNNLALKMFSGYINVDCLIHFDEEFMRIVNDE